MKRTVQILPLLLAVAFAACGDDAASGNTQRSDTGPDCVNRLQTVGPAQVEVGVQRAEELTVLLTDCNSDPLVGQTLEFAVVGDIDGVTLSSMSPPTGADGRATVILTTGTDEGSFQVEVSATDAAPIAFDITVDDPTTRPLDVRMDYDGQLQFDRFTAYAYPGTCEIHEEWTLDNFAAVSDSTALVSDTLTLQGVPIETPHAVLVRAEIAGEVEGFGCSNVPDPPTSLVLVQIIDKPAIFDGLYVLDNTFDLSESPPPSIERVLALAFEASDDHDLGNENPDDDQYGQDPAAFLLDFVFRQVCCWEATEPSPTFDNCEDQESTHPNGDLSAMYLHEFNTWEGAQSRFSGLCTGVWAAADILQALVQDLLEESVPDITNLVLGLVEDLRRSLENMRITSHLTISELGISKVGNFTHELVSFRVELRDLEGNPNTYEVSLADAGVENRSYTGPTAVTGVMLDLPAHTYEFDLGKLLRYTYLQAVLPELGYMSTQEMLGSFINCTSVGEWLEDNIGILDVDDYAGYCEDGLDAVADYIEDTIDDISDTTTELTFEGMALAGEVDENDLALTIADGVWVVSWEERADEGMFPGTFTGTRQEQPEQ